MFDLRTIVRKKDHALLSSSQMIAPEDPKQRKFMLGALCLLLLALGIVLWRDRDFWFPEPTDADYDQPIESSPVAKPPVLEPPAAKKPAIVAKRKRHLEPQMQNPSPTEATTPASQQPVAISARTVLPPLEVEVIAGDTHRIIRPGSTSVRVNLQPGTSTEPVTDVAGNRDNEPAANVKDDAAERVQMSADASEIVVRPVRPNYPLLARQMRVEGSVILQALIGRDGIIQNLRVLSGPRILAGAAQDAVRQWHFKPHLEGSEAVETEAKITVNFTISTN